MSRAASLTTLCCWSHVPQTGSKDRYRTNPTLERSEYSWLMQRAAARWWKGKQQQKQAKVSSMCPQPCVTMYNQLCPNATPAPTALFPDPHSNPDSNPNSNSSPTFSQPHPQFFTTLILTLAPTLPSPKIPTPTCHNRNSKPKSESEFIYSLLLLSLYHKGAIKLKIALTLISNPTLSNPNSKTNPSQL